MALKTRPFNNNDLEFVEKIHEKYFGNLQFPDFMNMLSAFIIEDDNNQIIMAGGCKPVVETYLVTNKEQSEIKIGKALIESQKISLFTCKKFNINECYAFTYNDNYAEHLIQHGFRDRDGRALVMRLYGQQ